MRIVSKNIKNIIAIITISLSVITLICLGIKEPLDSRFRYLYRGSVGQKYVYWLKEGKMRQAVVSQTREGAKNIAKVINGEKDSFDFMTMKIGAHISCLAKKELRDTVRIDGVLFAVIQYAHGTGRLSVIEYLYVPEKFLFDDVNGDCTENGNSQK